MREYGTNLTLVMAIVMIVPLAPVEATTYMRSITVDPNDGAFLDALVIDGKTDVFGLDLNFSPVTLGEGDSFDLSVDFRRPNGAPYYMRIIDGGGLEEFALKPVVTPQTIPTSITLQSEMQLIDVVGEPLLANFGNTFIVVELNGPTQFGSGEVNDFTHTFLAFQGIHALYTLDTLVGPSVTIEKVTNVAGVRDGGEITLTEPCDFDADGSCNVTDIDLMFQQGNLVMGKFVTAGNLFDLDTNRVINQLDIDQWLVEAASSNGYMSEYRRGDADGLDSMTPRFRDVDIIDLLTIVVNFNPTGAGSNNLWEEGNFDGDNDIDITDFKLLTSNFAPTSYHTFNTVPEPTSTVLSHLGLIITALFAMHQRICWSENVTSAEGSPASRPAKPNG